MSAEDQIDMTKRGAYAALARKLKIERATVSVWFKPGGRVPAERVVEVEAATGIARHKLRPDLHLPPAGTGEAA